MLGSGYVTAERFSQLFLLYHVATALHATSFVLGLRRLPCGLCTTNSENNTLALDCRNLDAKSKYVICFYFSLIGLLPLSPALANPFQA
jgi:hypothetical protein